MKTYKIIDLDRYIVNVFSKEEACLIALISRIGITPNDIEETNLHVDRMEVIAKVMTYEELKPYIL